MPVSQRDLFVEVAALRKQGKVSEALRLLRDALRRRRLDAEGIEKAGRSCGPMFSEMGQVSAAAVDARITLLGQCTTSWLANVVTAVAWGQGVRLAVTEGAYDNVMQELLAASTISAPDVVVLVPWNQRLLSLDGSNRSPEERVEDECAFWRQAWGLVMSRLSARILQVGYDWTTPGSLGQGLGAIGGGDVSIVRQVNQGLRQVLPAGAFFLDLEQTSGTMGRERFYDSRRYFWTKQPFSEDGAVRLAEHIWAGIRALLTGPKKVLVLDLDNTLWGGVVGETGPLGIGLGDGPDGEAFRAFQRHVKQLTERGVLLTVCSKNNDSDAREPFEKNPNMELSLDDFAHFEASWDPKAVAIQRTADTLQLGLDSFVFFDDNPAEREHIRQALWDVEVIEVPPDPSGYIGALEAGGWFEAVALTSEDRQRVAQYRSESRRRQAEASFETLDAYLESLQMVADVRVIDDCDLDRVVQLIGKTNQFNLTTKRHSTAVVRGLLERPGTIGLTLRLTDRFGDHGLVAVLLALEETSEGSLAPKTMEIDTWLMSCRVISRTVEEFSLNVLTQEARRRGAGRLVGRYVPTKKNALVKDLYDRLGFSRLLDMADGSVSYDLDLEHAVPVKTFVQPAATVGA